MITAITIGSNGRLGNQMFQYAALHGIAKFHGFDYWSPAGRLFDVFEMGDAPREPKGDFPNLQIREEMFEFDSRYFSSMVDNVDLWGYFQSEKYWEFCKGEVVQMFRFKESIELDVDFSSHCSLHIRRTDYLNSPEYHTNLAVDYYINALKEVSTDKLLVFSDDPAWCKENLGQLTHRVAFASDFCNNDVDELQLMTKCSSAIIANSTFSWWGAYLGPHSRGGKVVAPRNWFGRMGPNAKDVCPSEWSLV